MGIWNSRTPYESAPARGWSPWSFLTPVILIVLGLAGFIVGSLPGQFSGLMRSGSPLADGVWPTVYQLTVMFGFTALLFIAWTKLVERRRLGAIGLVARGAPLRFVKGFGLALAMLGVIIAGIVALGGASVGDIGPAWSDPIQLAYIAAILGGFMIQGSTEEIVFRGWMLTAVAARRGVLVGLIASSVLFGLLHGFNIWPPDPVSLANVALFGVFMGLLALNEGSILGACGWHAGWNWALGTGFQIEVSGGEIPVRAWIADLDVAGSKWISGGAWGPEASLVTTAVLAVGCVWYAMKLRGERAPDAAAAG